MMDFTLNNTKYDLLSYPNIAILGNTGCGKTTIARKIIKELLSNNIEVEVIGSKADFEYSDINSKIDDNDDYFYYSFIEDLYNELNERKNSNSNGIKLIVLDDLTDSIPYTPLYGDEGFTNKLSSLLREGYKYGMYFIIISQRITDSVYKSSFRDNTHIHIYMRCNNDKESEFLVGDNSLTSFGRGEYKVELK